MVSCASNLVFTLKERNMDQKYAETAGLLYGNLLGILLLFLWLFFWVCVVWVTLKFSYAVITQDFGSGLRPLVEAVWCGKPGCWK